MGERVIGHELQATTRKNLAGVGAVAAYSGSGRRAVLDRVRRTGVLKPWIGDGGIGVLKYRCRAGSTAIESTRHNVSGDTDAAK